MSASKIFNCNCGVFVGLCEWHYVICVWRSLPINFLNILPLGWWCGQFGGDSHLWPVKSEWLWARGPEDSTHKDWAFWVVWETVEKTSFRNHSKRIYKEDHHWVLFFISWSCFIRSQTKRQLARQIVAHLIAISIIVVETSLAFGFWSLLAARGDGAVDGRPPAPMLGREIALDPPGIHC